MSFHDCQIISVGTEPAAYHHRDASIKRGDPKFVMSRSELMEFWHCPARWLAGVPEPFSSAMDFGALLDCAILQPDKFESRYIVAPATYPANSKHEKVRSGEIAEGDPLPWNNTAAFCKEWNATAKKSGKLICSAEDYAHCQDALKVLGNDEIASEYISRSDKQVWVGGFWNEIPLKALLDLRPRAESGFRSSIGDLKVSYAIHPSKWPRHMVDHGWDVQAAFYLDLYCAAVGLDKEAWRAAMDFRHIIVESSPPFQIGRRIVSSEFIALARCKYEAAFALYEKCLESGKWPGYDDNPANLIPGWSFAKPEMWMMNQLYPENL
jgi:hypothetical protein